jgi:hypothetical protein
MYKGQAILIPMGEGGLQSDSPQSRIAPTQLIEARNVTLVNGYCEKHPGSRAWNQRNPNTSAINKISSGVQTFCEYFPNATTQRIIVLSRDGLLYKYNSRYELVQLTPQTGAPSVLGIPANDAHIVVAGNEVRSGFRKVFVFSGGSQVQVIDQDENTYRNIKNPAVDWAASYPKFGLVYRSRLWCFGNENAADFLYASEEANQENFSKFSSPSAATDPQFFDVGSGEGFGITGLFVFKNRLFICKSPSGLYQLNDEDSNPANWYITKVNADFGLSNSHGIAQVFDDVFIFNTQGSVTSVAAAFQFGDIESADVFNKLGVERYFRQNTTGFGTQQAYGLYYPDKKQVYFSVRTQSSGVQDGIIVMDIFGKSAQVTFTDKDRPSCLGLISDIAGISRPAYGSFDGNIYEMDCDNTWVQSQSYNQEYVEMGYWEPGYTDIDFAPTSYNFVAQTPHMDFAFADPIVSMKTKRWDFLEVTFQPTGNWNVDVDVYVDSEYRETISYNLLRDRPLSEAVGLPGFILDTDRLDGDFPKSIRKPLHGQGRTISFKLRSNGLSENIKIQSLTVYFRVADERQIKDPRT